MRFRIPRVLLAALPLIGSSLAAQSAPDQLTERSNVAAPLTAVLPHTPNEGYGGPRVIQVDYNNDGVINSSDRVFMYVTGIEDFSAPVKNDKIFLFQNPNTFSGWNNAYNLAPRITILPKSGTGCVGCETGVNYANQWPYEREGKIWMVAGVGRANNSFTEYLLGESTDGINFQWERWLKAPTDWLIGRLGWQAVQIAGGAYYYGFADMRDNRTSPRNPPWGIAALRYDQSNQTLEFLVNRIWTRVDACNDGSGFRFCLKKNGQWIYPDFEVSLVGAPHTSFHRLSRHGGKLELWYTKATSKNGCGYDDGLNIWQNVFAYRTVQAPASLTALPSLGTEKLLLQETSNPVRCNPASYQHSRKTPFRLDWTLDIFYSRSWDDPSNPFGPNTTGPEGYIVRTRLCALGSECSNL